uniref:30S ribosomal protein S31, chloroplastic n=1 Tax=Anthurium amnicola TaxID=1678845 RepID=A0A1D1ZK81_9ARAE
MSRMAMVTAVAGAAAFVPMAASLSVLGASSSTRQLAFSRAEALAGISLSSSPPSLSVAASPPLLPGEAALPSLPLVYCGRGDKKTAKGKRFNRSFGNARPRDKKKGRGPPRALVPPSPPKKDRFDDGEIVKIEIDESLFS